MNLPAVLIRKSTKEIVKFSDYPREEPTPFLEGEIDPDYEWLIYHVPFEEPVYDPRIFIMVTNLPNLQFLDSFQYHPQYPGIREYRVTYSPQKRSNLEIITSIENAEKEANDSIWSEAIHKDKMLLMVAASNKKASGQQLNVTEQEYLDEMNSIAVKVSKNSDNKNILVEQVNSNQEPNIDSGWERN